MFSELQEFRLIPRKKRNIGMVLSEWSPISSNILFSFYNVLIPKKSTVASNEQNPPYIVQIMTITGHL